MNAAGVSVTTITGSDLIDTLVGDASSTISGGGGNDIITGGSGNDTITGGDGDDVITPNAGSADSVDGGAGNDRIVIDTDADIVSGNTIAGGDGTDTFAITAVQTNNAASDLRGVSGFEILELASTATESLAMSDFINNQTFTRVDFGEGGTGTLTVTNATESVTEVRLITGPPGDTIVFDRLVDNASNSLTISNRADNSIAVTALTIADEETVSISGSSATNDLLITTLNSADMTSLTISGAGDVAIAGALTGTRMTTIDSSAATGLTETHATNNVVAVTITGGSGADEVTGGLLADTITGNLGADIIIGGAGADTISGGGGADVITGGTGADIVDVGSGANDMVVIAGANGTVATNSGGSSITLSGADVYSSVAATDQIIISGYTATTANAAIILWCLQWIQIFRMPLPRTLTDYKEVTMFKVVLHLVPEHLSLVLAVQICCLSMTRISRKLQPLLRQ
jgi:Ca2+-binding RTX toxin-like protein